jgi:hypothetical protein
MKLPVARFKSLEVCLKESICAVTPGSTSADFVVYGSADKSEGYRRCAAKSRVPVPIGSVLMGVSPLRSASVSVFVVGTFGLAMRFAYMVPCCAYFPSRWPHA